MAHENLLKSWADTPTTAAITAFVQTVTEEGSPSYVAPAERVATFDNDGTLWTREADPDPARLHPAPHGRTGHRRSPASPTASRTRPRCEQDYHWLGAAMVKHYHGDDSDMGLLLAAVSTAFDGHGRRGSSPPRWTSGSPPRPTRCWSGRTCRAGSCRWSSCCATSRRTASRPTSPPVATATSCGRSPRASTASRPSGSSAARSASTSTTDADVTGLLYKSKIEFFDDGPTKPVRIWSRLGRRPLVAGGNSNGDIEMLRFARSRRPRPGCGCSSCTTTPSASSTTPAAPRTRSPGPPTVAGRSSRCVTIGPASSGTGEPAQRHNAFACSARCWSGVLLTFLLVAESHTAPIPGLLHPSALAAVRAFRPGRIDPNNPG